MDQNKKTGLIVLGIIAILALIALSSYNGLIDSEEEVDGAWAQVENVYQRRMDLIPNLVATVKGSAAHESDTLTAVTEARAKLGGVTNINVSDEILNDPAAFQRYQQAQSELSGALQRLMMVSESYPDLKANQNFLSLQDQLEGTENRITVERKRFNDAVKIYNRKLRRIPTLFFAKSLGLEKKAYFESSAGAETAPSVQF